MKRITLLIALLFVTVLSTAQEKEDQPMQDVNKKHEVKINALSLIGFDWLDVSYEYLINNESSFGVALLVSLGDDESDITDFYKTFSITPYYRFYFSNKYARGFFVEGFGMLNTRKELNYGFYGDTSFNRDTKTNFALGISVGGKFVTTKGFTAEVYLGLGRNLLNGSENISEIVGRGGISLGYRF